MVGYDSFSTRVTGRHLGDVAGLLRPLGQAGDSIAILRRVVEQAVLLVSGAEGSAVELVDDDTLVYVATAGSLRNSTGLRIPVASSLSGLAITTDATLSSDDTELDPRVDREACRRIAIRSMVCVPLGLDGHPVGVLKVASGRPEAFTDRDVRVLSRLAEFVATAVTAAVEFARVSSSLVSSADGSSPGAGQDDPDGDADRDVASFVANVMGADGFADEGSRQRIEVVLAEQRFHMLYQPVFDLHDGTMVGAEALARFTEMPYRPPDQWFAEAERVGLGVEMELAAVRAALTPLPFLPGSIRLSVNVGPATIGDPGLAQVIDAAGPDRVILELTEHLRVEDYPQLNGRLARLRADRTLLAIDDTGAGISSLTHVLKLAPDVIKLDREITRGVDIDPVRRALTSALIVFARESGAHVVAEGVETAQELSVLKELGVRFGQGFHLCRPIPPADLAGLQVAASASW